MAMGARRSLKNSPIRTLSSWLMTNHLGPPEAPTRMENCCWRKPSSRSRLAAAAPASRTTEFLFIGSLFWLRPNYHSPVFSIEAQGSCGCSGSPLCSNSMEILSGERTKAI